MSQTPNADQVLAALTAAGLTVTGHQIEADSIDIHLDHTYAGFATDYRAVALGWRPERWAGQVIGGMWYLLPSEPEEEGKPAPHADMLTGDGTDSAEVVREVLEMFAFSDEWIASRRPRGAPVIPEEPAPAEIIRTVLDGPHGERPAEPGEVCTCGRPAIVIFFGGPFGETGYCGRPDGGQRGRCMFCGGQHDGRCPQYKVRPDGAR